jgi:acetylornithine deacetylase/succinyl-diaminopimelate desuccinylase-like protein
LSIYNFCNSTLHPSARRPANKPEIYHAADYWKQLLLNAGTDRAEVYESDGNPVTYGEKIIDPAKPTVLVYAHMDGNASRSA